VIDEINTAADISNKKEKDLDIYEIPDYQESGDEIQIHGTSLTLKLYADDSGNLNEVTMYWYNDKNNTNVITSAGFYFALLTGMFGGDNSDNINDQISKARSSGEKIDVAGNGSTFHYEYSCGGNQFTMEPAK
jgi:hypothetical protein